VFECIFGVLHAFQAKICYDVFFLLKGRRRNFIVKNAENFYHNAKNFA